MLTIESKSNVHLMWNLIVLVICLACTGSSVASENNDSWSGSWFPVRPGQKAVYHETTPSSADLKMQTTQDCDDAEHNLAIDFDPANQTHRLLHSRCLSADPTAYKSSYDVQPVLFDAIVPKAYRPLHRCMNESIHYEDGIPTFGNHRPIWPQYGEYAYVPIQRWLHSIEHGAIVMLYHPCAIASQVQALRQLVSGCLFRHIITPSQLPSAERPLVLVSWGRRLEMSAVDAKLVRQFIRSSAKRGLEQYSKEGHYTHLLLTAANVVSDIEDAVLCPHSE